VPDGEILEVIKLKLSAFDICDKIIENNGELYQMGILQEEAAELIQIISKYRRGKVELEDLKEEMADLFITWWQIYNLMPDKVDEEIAAKLKKLSVDIK